MVPLVSFYEVRITVTPKCDNDKVERSPQNFGGIEMYK